MSALIDRLVVATLPLIPKPIVKAVASRYVAGDTRGSLIAGRRAIELTDPAKRVQAKAQLDIQRKQIDQARVQGASQQATNPGTSPLGGG